MLANQEKNERNINQNQLQTSKAGVGKLFDL